MGIYNRLTEHHHQAILLIPSAANCLRAREDAHVLSAVVEVVGTETRQTERALRAFDTIALGVFQNKTTNTHWLYASLLALSRRCLTKISKCPYSCGGCVQPVCSP
jgi:hypothetical protein